MAFSAFSIFFTLTFLIIIAGFIVVIISGISTWNKNNHSPRLTVPAVIVAKRTDISQNRHANAGDVSGAHGYHITTTTWYYVTFQVASGDRMEFPVSGTEYGMLAEGDEGELSFQGTRYLGFERKNMAGGS